MISQDLLQILCCPETHQTLTPAEPGLIARLNELIAAGQLRNRGGEVVRDRIDGGLIRADKEWVYPIRQDIPIMLIDEALPIKQQQQ